MRNLLLKIAFNGSNYHGYQIQKNAITVAETLQNAIKKLIKHKINLKGCSRTDAGTHAYEYYVNFKTENNIPCENLIKGLNTFLPKDIVILDCTEVTSEFHARYSVKNKEYVYKILNMSIRDPFYEGLAYWYKYHLDVNKLNTMAQQFIGTHDFKSFCSTDSRNINFVKTIYKFNVHKHDNIVYFTNTQRKAPNFSYGDISCCLIEII